MQRLSHRLFLRQARQYHLAWLLLVLAAGTFMRLKGLTFQSLWYDELYSVVEADPTNSIKEVYSFLRPGVDLHPPLYYTLLHFWFKILGYNDFTARLLSAVGGVASIFAIYLLGRELHNRNTGLIAAVITAFNYYNIYYSQEARNYIFAFVFSCISFLYLTKALKKPGYRSCVSYAVATSLLLYTHYYGFMVLAAQVFIIGIYVLSDVKKLLRNVLYFGSAGILMLLLYLPWLGVMLDIGATGSFWISRPPSNFFVSYFAAYFGSQYGLVYIFAFLLILFAARAFQPGFQLDSAAKLFSNPPLFGFTVLFTWYSISYLVPYVRSLIDIPMLFDRYTIVTLPAIIIAVSIGLESVGYKLLKIYLMVLIVGLSVVDIFFAKAMYTTETKEGWREVAGFVARNNAANYPVVSGTPWHDSYYFGQNNYRPTYLKPGALKKYQGEAFWVLVGHDIHAVDSTLQKHIDQAYRIDTAVYKIYTSAKLYKRK